MTTKTKIWIVNFQVKGVKSWLYSYVRCSAKKLESFDWSAYELHNAYWVEMERKIASSNLFTFRQFTAEIRESFLESLED
uniref:Uncharacterized protein n=1 Tax=Leviviridae sp. TaxID=2027243 RepID=A0A514DD54_9VIRU|nr:MAG: hypothetical protein H1RhizoLitter1273_000001 [Leviviridae sp.]